MPTTEFPAVTDDPQARNGHVKVERRERVIVRFAGDSGDGMQLAGGRFTDATAVLRQRPRHAAELPGRDPRPRRHARRRLGFQIHFAARDIAHAGRHAQRAGGDEPRRAARERRASSSAAATIIVNEDAFTTRNLQKAGYDVEPARGRLARRLPGQARADDARSSSRAVEGARGRHHARRPAGRATSSRSASSRWLYDRPTEVTERWIEAKFADKPDRARRQPRRLPGRLAASARRPS